MFERSEFLFFMKERTRNDQAILQGVGSFLPAGRQVRNFCCQKWQKIKK
jgi:hypothetical protein